MEGADAGKYAGDAPEFEIGPPDVGPTALDGDPAWNTGGRGKTHRARLLPKAGFEAGEGHEEEFEWSGGWHGSGIPEESAGNEGLVAATEFRRLGKSFDLYVALQ